MSESTMPPLESTSAGPDRAGSPSPPPPPWWPQPKRRRPFWKRALISGVVIVLVLSLMMCAYLFVFVAMSRLVKEDGLSESVLKPGRDDQVVAVYEVSGVINNKQAELIDAFCKQVGSDADVKAVVIRVSSPGGGVSACDRIHKLLKDLKARNKTLVVSMGSVAASGGYYISAPAETIYAEPTTVTGSIGVLGCWVIIKGTLEKYGAKAVVVRSTKTRAWKAAPNLFEDPADYQIAEIQRLLDAFQERFEDVVRSGRGVKLKIKTSRKTYKDADGEEFTVEETVPFNGKVFLADEARKLGLIDNVGFLDEAVDEASRLAGLSDPKVVRYVKRKGLMEHLGLARTGPVINLEVLEEIQTPRLMMVWKVSP